MTATPPPVVSERRRTAESVAGYVCELGEQLLRFGCPTYRVEQLVVVVADLAGYDAEVFALPTALHVMVAARGQESVAPVQRLARIRNARVDLGRLVALDKLFNDVADGVLTIEAARARLRELDDAAKPLTTPVLAAISASIAGSAAIAFGGGEREAGFAAIVGCLVLLLDKLLSRRPDAIFLLEFLSGLVVSLGAFAATHVAPGVSPQVIILAGLLGLFPGMAFTTGIAELAQRHMVAGAARLLQAVVTLVSLVFGLAVALGITTLLGLPELPDAARAAPGFLRTLGVSVVISLGLGLLMGIPRPLLWAAVAPSVVTQAAFVLAGERVPVHLASFLAAVVASSLANLLARVTDRPAQLYQVTALTLLVPGSFGFLSFDGFLRGDTDVGLQRAVGMLLVAGGLVMGVLLANVLVRPRKLL